ncbi:MAG: hypothetical protein QOJ16_1500 [Acidobacteriota bacterium]|jgi:hypothetical protein|nr:hypothetical protein [Acidobacteriota bacterium]
MRRARWIRATLAAALFSSMAVPAARGTPGADLPAVELREKVLVLSSLPAVLARPEVRPHLSTGLTTTLLIAVEAVDGGGRKAKGGGKVDIRYEPWDELFLVSALGVDGRSHQESLPSFDRLLAWWRGVQLPVLAAEPLLGIGGTGSTGSAWQVKVHLSVIPFSRSEQRETQRWLADSIGRPAKGDPQAAGARAEPLSGALDALLATSIKRQSLVGYDWTLAFQPERRR